MLSTVYHMDCLKYMKEKLNDGIIDCIVTSPPYNLGGDFHTFVDGKRVTYGDYNTYKDKMKESEYQSWQIDVLNECYRVLKPGGVMFYNHKNRIVNGTIISPFEWLHKTNFNIYQVVVLNLKSTANVDKRRFFPVHELLFILTKNKDTKLNNKACLTDVWEMKKVPRKISGHPATFHEDLPTRCILAATKEGDVVFDPFIGVGTTAVACYKNHRKWLGCEIDAKYHLKIAENLVNAM